jgi:branched-chain amino acid transport system ATP-binding protein
MTMTQVGVGSSLSVRGLEVAYGHTQVLFGVDLDVGATEIVALLGTNGAGKSTLLKAVVGSVPPKRGRVSLDDREITGIKPHKAAALGVALMPGGKGAFPSLTVGENFRLAGWVLGRDTADLDAATDRVLDYFPILRDRWDQRAGDLSGGEQQMLSLGQVFIGKPALLMLDELTLGLAPTIINQLLAIVRDIHANGTTVILVEQSVNVALNLAQRAIFMEKGEIHFDGPTDKLLDDREVLRSVFLEGATQRPSARVGVNASSLQVRAKRAVERCDVCGHEAETVLSARGITVSFGGIKALTGVDIDARRGQILGIIGPNGAGKTTLFDAICGYLPIDRGQVVVCGRDVSELAPDARAVAGLGRSFQDARLFPTMTVAEAISTAFERHLESRDALAAFFASPATKAAELSLSRQVDRLLEQLGLGAFANKFVSELSTGSRRIVELACVLAHDPAVLMLDEPSSGIAQRESEALGPLLCDISESTNAAIILIEHDMSLIQAVSDQILALDLGTVVTRGFPEDVLHHPLVVSAYLGTTENDAPRAIAHGPEAAPLRRTSSARVAR